MPPSDTPKVIDEEESILRRYVRTLARYERLMEISRERILALIHRNEQLTASLERVEKGEIDPYSATDELLGSKALLQTWRTSLEREE